MGGWSPERAISIAALTLPLAALVGGKGAPLPPPRSVPRSAPRSRPAAAPLRLPHLPTPALPLGASRG